MKRLSDFDFAFQPSIDRTLIEELATGRFLDEGRNVIFQGPPGVGKTHLAIALGLACCRARSPPAFLTALDLAAPHEVAFAQNRMPPLHEDAHDPEAAHRRRSRLPRARRPRQASLLFQVICVRYEKQSRHHHHLEQGVLPTGARSSPATPSWPPPPSTASCTAPPSSTSRATPIACGKNATPDSSKTSTYPPNPKPTTKKQKT